MVIRLLLIMALSFAHGAVQWLAADAATTVYTVSGLSFQPKAIRFYWQGLGSAVDAGSDTVHQRRGVGFAVSTSDRRCVGSQSQDATASMTCTTGYRTDCVAMTLTSTPAADGLLDLNSITADGFTLIVDDQAPADVTIFWEAWGGSDITVAVIGEIAEPAATGDQDYTVTGFTSTDSDDQVVMFAGVQETGAAPVASRNDSGLCVGFATGGAAGENVVIVGNSDDGSASADTDNYALDGECLAMITTAGGNPNARAKLTQFGTNNFRLNWIARGVTNRRYIFLAIKGGNWRAGGSTLDSNTVGATATISGLPFTPIGLSVISQSNAENTPGTSNAFDVFLIGTGSSPTSRRGMGSIDYDGAGNAAIELQIQYDQIFCMPTGTSVKWSADLDAMNADGFRLITDVGADEGTVLWVYLTYGNVAAAAFLAKNHKPVLQAVNRGAVI